MNNPIDTVPIYIRTNPSVYSDYNQFDEEYTSVQIEPSIQTLDQKADLAKEISIAFFTLAIGAGILFIAYSIFTSLK